MIKLICLLLGVVLVLAGCGRGEGQVQTPPQAQAPASPDGTLPAPPQEESGEGELPAPPQEEPDLSGEEETMQKTIAVTVGEARFTATLARGAAAEQFYEMLPMTLDMSELNGNEKYSYLDERLPTAARVPNGIACGDLMLYGASCVVLFYEDFTTSYSYTPLGKIENAAGLQAALGRGSVRVTFAKEG